MKKLFDAIQLGMVVVAFMIALPFLSLFAAMTEKDWE